MTMCYIRNDKFTIQIYRNNNHAAVELVTLGYVAVILNG